MFAHALVCLASFVYLQSEGRLITAIPEGAKVGPIAFSDDGKVAAYMTGSGDQFWIVAGEWKSKPSRLRTFPAFVKGRRDVLYFTLTDRDTCLIHLNDSVLFETPSIRESHWTLPGVASRDGKTVASPVKHLKSGKSGIAINGKIQNLHLGSISSYPDLSEDGKVFAFALETENGHLVVVNETPGPVLDWVTQPALSVDGKVVAYGAEQGEQWFLMHGERKISVKAEVKGVFLSSDGKYVGYWKKGKKEGEKGQEQVVVGDKEGPEFASVMMPVFSPDAKHVTYRAEGKDGKPYVVLDEKRFEASGLQSNPVFLDNGRKIGYGILKGQELRWMEIEVK